MQRLLIALLVAALALTPAAAEQLKATLFKQPYCGCCDGHADHLRQNGYDVTVQQTGKLSSIKKRYRVPQEFEGCHTTIIGGYVAQRVVEGVFMRRFGGMHIHVWRPIDSKFRLITARRNPNMVILFAALLVMRPDSGLVLVAWWTIISLIFHSVRFAQASERVVRGEKIVSWLEG